MRGSAGGVPLKLPDFQGPAWMRAEQDLEVADAFGILPENWDAACAFFNCTTQWRIDARNVLIGLRYSALDLVIKHQNCTDPDDAFRRAQTMERAAVDQSRRMASKS